MMKIGVYFIMIAFLVANLFKILIYANYMTCDVTRWTQNHVKSKNMYGISVQILTGLKFCWVDILQELHIVIVVMLSP